MSTPRFFGVLLHKKHSPPAPLDAGGWVAGGLGGWVAGLGWVGLGWAGWVRLGWAGWVRLVGWLAGNRVW